MGRLFWWQVGLGTAGVFLLVIVALIAVGGMQPSLPGRWCEDKEAWFLCFRDWQALVGGLLALTGAALVIVVHQSETHDRRRAARLAVTMQLQDLYRDVSETVFKHQNHLMSEGFAGEPINTLPLPAFAKDASALAHLLPDESQALADIAERIREANNNAAGLLDVADPEEVEDHLYRRGGDLAILVFQLRNKFAQLIGWDSKVMAVDDERALRRATEGRY